MGARQELQIKAMEQQRKDQKDQADVALAQARLQKEDKRIQLEAQKENIRLQSQDKQTDKKIQADLLKTAMAKRNAK